VIDFEKAFRELQRRTEEEAKMVAEKEAHLQKILNEKTAEIARLARGDGTALALTRPEGANVVNTTGHVGTTILFQGRGHHVTLATAGRQVKKAKMLSTKCEVGGHFMTKDSYDVIIKTLRKLVGDMLSCSAETENIPPIQDNGT
jgi:hypothetical protein